MMLVVLVTVTAVLVHPPMQAAESPMLDTTSFRDRPESPGSGEASSGYWRKSPEARVTSRADDSSLVFWTGCQWDRLMSIPRPSDLLARGFTPAFSRTSQVRDTNGPGHDAGTSSPAVNSTDQHVSIIDKGSHYEVDIRFDDTTSRFAIGAEYGAKIKMAVPDFEQLVDSYLGEGTFNGFIYRILIHRARRMRMQLPEEYKEEIDGIASQMSGGTTNKRGDGKLSVDELYLLNLLGDVCRLSSCCAVTVNGDRSATHHPLIGRNLDWPDGKDNQMTKLHAIITMHYPDVDIVSVSCLGFQAVCTGVNSAGVFAGVLDSPTGARFQLKRRSSYLFDLRAALEHEKSLEGVARFMTDPARTYTFNHLIALADKEQAGILENNFSGKGQDMHRALRFPGSALNPQVEWDVPDSLGAVNWFALKGNQNNVIDPLDRRGLKKGQSVPDKNTARWNALRQQLKLLGTNVSLDGLKQVVGYSRNGGSMYKGDLYNYFTMQTVVFDPLSLTMEVAFRPRNGRRPPRPIFERIQLSIRDRDTDGCRTANTRRQGNIEGGVRVTNGQI